MTHWEPLYRDYFSEDHDKSYRSKKEQNQMKFACLFLFTLPECPPRISLDGRYVSKTVTFLSSFISFRFLRGLRVFCHQWQIWKKEKKKKVENPGIDPGTSRMRSRRSTTWANSPATATYINTLVKIVPRKAQPVLQLCSLILSFTTHLTSLILYQRRNVFKLQLKDFGGLTKTNVIWASSPATTTNGFS